MKKSLIFVTLILLNSTVLPQNTSQDTDTLDVPKIRAWIIDNKVCFDYESIRMRNEDLAAYTFIIDELMPLDDSLRQITLNTAIQKDREIIELYNQNESLRAKVSASDIALNRSRQRNAKNIREVDRLTIKNKKHKGLTWLFGLGVFLEAMIIIKLL